jgi:sugar phosphate isomerase/epimerase
MKISQVAAQLYTVREYCKTAPDFAETLKKIRAIGYQAVQISGVGPIPEADLVRMLNKEGLVCCATHEGSILSDPGKVVERLRQLNCRYTAYPYPSGITLNTLADVKELARRLNASGRILADAGQVLTYHNHSIEFRRFDGRVMLDVLFAETDPACLQGEIDTFWVQYGGGSPEEWCRKLNGRLPLLHLKDYGVTSEAKHTFTEIGYGNLNWKAIIAAADQAGCEWYIVEQDTCPGNPFESLKKSFDYIKETLCT